MNIDHCTVFSVEETPEALAGVEAAESIFTDASLVTIDSTDTIDESTDLCVAVGGDGSYLEAVYRCGGAGVPVTGIHNGSLGFLSRIPFEKVDEALRSIKRGESKTINRGRVESSVGDFTASGLNEVMVVPNPPEKAVDRKICSIHAYISDTYIGRFDGSGLAVATPTGSTAVALSAGGPVHYPNNNFSLQLTPLQTHNLGVRPLIFDGDTELRLFAESDVTMMVDGGREMRQLSEGEELSITGSGTPAKLVRTPYDDSFFDSLVEKLGWNLRGVDETGPHSLK